MRLFGLVKVKDQGRKVLDGAVAALGLGSDAACFSRLASHGS